MINFLLQIFDYNLKVRWWLKSYVILCNKFSQTLNSSFLATLNSNYGIVVSNLTIMCTIGHLMRLWYQISIPFHSSMETISKIKVRWRPLKWWTNWIWPLNMDKSRHRWGYLDWHRVNRRSGHAGQRIGG